MTASVDRPASKTTITRRTFLGVSAGLGGLALIGCSVDEAARLSPRAVPDAFGRRFLTADEVRTVEAVCARIFPGTPESPGAREAGVVDYIDGKLSRFRDFAVPSYLAEPFVEVLDDADDFLGDGVILAVPASQVHRYGFQSGVLPQNVYRDGVVALDEYAVLRHDAVFAQLPEDAQDDILRVLDDVAQAQDEGEEPDATGLEADEIFGEVGAGTFFTTVRADVIEGLFADPQYGGNRDMAGWRHIGYPGSHRAYTPEEMLREVRRRPQPLDELTPMQPDRREDGPRGALEQPLDGVHDGHGGHGHE